MIIFHFQVFLALFYYGFNIFKGLVATFKPWPHHYARLLRLASCLSIMAFEHYLLFIACKVVIDAMKCCVSDL